MALVVMVGRRKDLLTCGLVVEPHGVVRMVAIVMSVRYAYTKTTSIMYAYILCEDLFIVADW